MRRRVWWSYLPLLTVLGLGLGVGAFAYDQAQRASVRTRPVARVPAVVARVDLAPGTTIDATMVAVESVSLDRAIPGGVASAQEAVGKVALAPVAAGEQIPAASLATPTPAVVLEARLADQLPPGRRAVGVAFVAVDGSGSAIRVGDTVDVVAVIRKGVAGLDEDATVVVASGAPVLAITGGDLSPAGTATLAVTPREAQLLALAQNSGELRLVRRSR